MRGKKVALAVIVLMLIAGGAVNILYVPDMEVADDTQTQVTVK
jgi:predicted small lipoprotein YifL